MVIGTALIRLFVVGTRLEIRNLADLDGGA